ncbi:hypothetical protein D3C85_1794340 [compost metagenome]
MITAERLVAERDFVPRGGVDFDRQSHPVLGTALHFENFDHARLVHDPIAGAALLIEMESVEFLFLHN